MYLLQVFAKFLSRLLDMHEIAVMSSAAGPFIILPASRLSEICNWWVLYFQNPPGIVSTIQRLYGSFRIFFIRELNVNVSNL